MPDAPPHQPRWTEISRAVYRRHMSAALRQDAVLAGRQGVGCFGRRMPASPHQPRGTEISRAVYRRRLPAALRLDAALTGH